MLDRSWICQETPLLSVACTYFFFLKNFKERTDATYRHSCPVINGKSFICSGTPWVKVEESQLGWLGCFGWAGGSGTALGLLLTDFG